MRPHWIDTTITYDGTQLRSHWIYERTGALGDAIASFIGPADVPLAHMVDLVDVARREAIASRSMLHFIAEWFDADLLRAIALQRLFAATALEEVRRLAPESPLRRGGDDLWSGDRKLSVSIATASPVSTLMHFAMNIESAGTPVPTVGLTDLRIDPRELARSLSDRFCAEIASMQEARSKVRPVG